MENSHSGTIERLQEGNVAIVVLAGEHDLSTAELLAGELEEACGAGASVVVDLSSVDFLDSSILRAVLDARERALSRHEHAFVLVAPPGSFASRVIALVAASVIPTYPDLGAAVASVSTS